MKKASFCWQAYACIVLFGIIVLGYSCNSNNDFSKTSKDYTGKAAATAEVLQKNYDCSSGVYKKPEVVYWWPSAVGLEAIIDYTMLTGSDKYLHVKCSSWDPPVDIISNTFEFAPISQHSPNFINDYYDDDGWWAITWIKAYDYTKETRYLEMAKTIFDEMTKGWEETTCGGGLWRSRSEAKYKAAIQNELFLVVAARLSLRTNEENGSTVYLEWAQRTWEWLKNSGMINSFNLINSGLDQDNNCENDGKPTWTYNQGVILGGLIDLYKSTGDIELLAQAQAIAQTALYSLSYENEVLQDVCEPLNNCDSDQEAFKGIFMRYLAYLYDNLKVLDHDTMIKVKAATEKIVVYQYLKDINSQSYDTLSFYKKHIILNAYSLWANARNASNQFGLKWIGPFDCSTVLKQTSALSALNAAIPFGQDYIGKAAAAAEVLQKNYHCSSGVYKNYNKPYELVHWWPSAVGLETIIDYTTLTGSDKYLRIKCPSGEQVDVISNTFDSAQHIAYQFLNDYYDDEGWWAITWIKAYDYTKDPRYLEMAKTIFDDMTQGWEETTCGGGLWWSTADEYKAAIQNELFLVVAARLSLRTNEENGSAVYLEWAQRTWEWFKNSGMINPFNLIDSGLDQDNNCENDGKPGYTYNQGVILGGLVDLYKSTGDIELLAQAQAIAQTALYSMSYENGVLQDVCEPLNNCDGDQEAFKGIFMRYLAYLYDNLKVLDHDTMIKVKAATEKIVVYQYLKDINSQSYDTLSFYEKHITLNADSLWANARNASNQFGLKWIGPFDCCSTVPKQTSALSALNAAIPFD